MNGRRTPLRRAFFAASLGFLLAGPPSPSGGETPEEAALRIISLAPSITETLFELGLGDRIAGVTNYCLYPEAARKIAKVGGYITPSFETMAALRPDLLFLLPEHEDTRQNLKALRAEIVDIDNRNVPALLESFRVIGRAAGAPDRGEDLAKEMQDRLDRIARTVAGRPKPKVLLCVSVSAGPSGIKEVRGGAPGSFHGDILRYAGAENAAPSGLIYYPLISMEGLLRIDPDVIVSFDSGAPSADEIRAEWARNSALKAVRAGGVHIFTQDFLTVPGPRLVRFIEDIARALHPDAPWEGTSSPSSPDRAPLKRRKL